MEDTEKTRYWRIQMDCGPIATGRIHAHLRDYAMECIQKGVGFQVTWWDSMDEAVAGEKSFSLGERPA